ncbi:MAG: GUN4 domain-containing protein, partial [Trichodesmium sp. St19_bin2]|nr:GUN4 domain-containing protein [Trichodesmium sp. St4_bin8_1]MDE5090671.1 GUN4 domain-containing protein [Trichodesmium sp. St18_bin3_1_1]MDE5104827.1 GUN4 domain-containing protein [Trichodesmium sp. St19_bin2]
DERFGFATQKRIYLETGNKLEQINWETYNHFGEKVGWREGGMWKNYFDLEFSLNSPEGHLPFCCAGFNVCVIAHLALLKDL